MPIKLVVFDMAGTTVIDKNFVARAFQNALEKEGITIPVKEINPLMGYEKRTAIQMLLEKKGSNSMMTWCRAFTKILSTRWLISMNILRK